MSETESFWSDDIEEENIDALTQKQLQLTDDELMEILVGKHRFIDQGKLLHIGIIDFLATYNTKKRLERWGKSIKRRGADVNTFSVAPADFYG